MTPRKAVGQLPSWREVAKPHQDILRGRFDLSIFAANLHEVYVENARDDYGLPERFFKLTFLTQGLQDLAESVVRRLAAKPGGEPVIDLMTSFGGGKTHALIALYHLAKGDPKARTWQGVPKILDDAGVKLPPQARAVVLPGDDINPVSGVKGKPGEPTRKTLWGELAWQLDKSDAFEELKENDEKRIAPSADDLAKLLGDGPNLILVDEALPYLSRAKGIPVHDSNLAVQTLNFFKALTEAASRSPRTCVVATMPTRVPIEMNKEDGGLFLQLSHLFRRIEKNRRLSEGMDIYEIVRRRLFEEQGDAAQIRKVVGAYSDYYRANEATLPPGVSSREYQERMERAYPFHPELLDILNERWSSVPNFQRTRGALRMLALLIADLYKDDSSLLIQPASVRLRNSDFRAEVLSQIDANPFDAVIESDIAGTGARASKVDQEGSALYQREHLAERTAAAIFLYSFGGSAGLSVATLSVLRLAVLHPSLEPEFIPGVLEDLKKRLYYLQIDGDQYRFSVQPNLNRLRYDQEANVIDTDIAKRLKDAVREQVAGPRFRVPLFPATPAEVRDEAVLTLAVIDPAYSWEKQRRPETEKFLQAVLDGDATHRRHRNVLVFLVAEEESRMRAATRTALALDAVDRLYGHNGKLGDSQKKDLTRMETESRNALVQSIWSAYHIVVTPGAKGWESRDLGHLIQRGSGTLQDEVWDLLVDKERVAPMLGPTQLAGDGLGLWPPDEEVISLSKVREAFAEYTYLPMLANPNVLQDCVARGVQEGTFGFAIGDGKTFEVVRFREQLDPQAIAFNERTWLLRPAAVDKARPSSSGAPEPPSPARSEAESQPTPGGKTGEAGSPNSYPEVTVEGFLEWKKWPEFYEGVLRPLIATGADVKIRVQASARSPGGIPKSVVDITVAENVSQRNLGVTVTTKKRLTTDEGPD